MLKQIAFEAQMSLRSFDVGVLVPFSKGWISTLQFVTVFTSIIVTFLWHSGKTECSEYSSVGRAPRCCVGGHWFKSGYSF